MGRKTLKEELVIVTKHIEHKINVRPYETITVGASIDWDDEDDIKYPGMDQDQILADMLEPDLRRIALIAHDQSYVHEWNQDD